MTADQGHAAAAGLEAAQLGPDFRLYRTVHLAGVGHDGTSVEHDIGKRLRLPQFASDAWRTVLFHPA